MVMPWHLLARRLARGHRVVYVLDPARTPSRSPSSDGQGITVVEPRDIPLQRIPGVRGIGVEWARREVLKGLADSPRPLVALLYPRCWIELAVALRPELLVYVVTDDFSVRDDGSGAPDESFLEWEALALETADLVLPVAEVISNRLAPGTDSPVVTFPMSFDEEVFDGRVQPVPKVLEGLPRPILGFVGTVRLPRIDLDLLRSAASLRPDWTFAFVGPVTEGPGATRDLLAGFGNVRFLDVTAEPEVPAIVGSLDVVMAPYRDEHVNRGYYPLKVLDGMAMGRACVVSPYSELAELHPHVKFAGDGPSFVRAVEEALREGNLPGTVRSRREAVAGRAIGRRVEQLESEVARLLGTTSTETSLR
jgi:glycosyltransferase involved in cell wall biosynthesis